MANWITEKLFIILEAPILFSPYVLQIERVWEPSSLYDLIPHQGTYDNILMDLMEKKGMTFDHDFYVVVSKQCRTVNAYAGH